ncbi:TonB-dependent receptor [Candidatus Albibeggiatoa sp. nov. BB20]|uniref:TonB-dependent receptor plug domain-containing protein n=1 Tax=Candidatus Albibeggiatoa sp. nov. BB20 TaxID=3162723 RepID=UPI0033659AB6
MRSLFYIMLMFALSYPALAQNLIINDLLDLSLEELFNVRVVSASKYLETSEDAPATIYVVTEEQIKKLGLRDLKDVLAIVPSVDISNNDFFLQGGQRGFTGSFAQSLILINGKEMNNLIAGETFFGNQFRTHNIKQIEIIAGPASALYGANAVGGLINIITKTPEEIDGIEARVSYDSFDSKTIDLVFGKSWGDFKARGSVSYYRSQEADFTDFLSNTALVSPKADNNSYRHLPNEYGYGNDSLALPISLNLEYKGLYTGLEYYKNISGRGTISVQWDYNLSEDYRELAMPYFGYQASNLLDGKLDLKAEYRYYWEKFWGNHTESTGTIENPYTGETLRGEATFEDVQAYRGFYSNKNSDGSTKHVASLEGIYRLKPKHTLTGGLIYTKTDVVSTQWSRVEGKHPVLTEANYQPAFKNDKWSLYFQDQTHWLDDKLILTLGMRLVKHQRYDNKLLPRYGLVYKATPKTIFKALYGKSFREPTVFELSGNPNIQPMEMDTYELAWHQYIGQHFKNELAIFDNQATNQIVANDITAFDNNGGKFLSRGLENRLSFKYHSLNGFLNYTYMDTLETEKEGLVQRVYDIPRHKANLALMYNLNSTHSLGIVGTYHSSVDTSYQGDIYTIKPYWLWDLTWNIAQQKWLDRAIGIDIGLKNVLNETYYHSESRGADILQHQQPGRSLWLQLSMDFK